MGKYCLSAEFADVFKKKLATGEINPEKLADMTSKERRDFFTSFLDKNNARNVNALFEKKLLQKHRWNAMINWAKETAGIKPEVKRDLVSRIQKIVKDEKGNIFSPESQADFLEDLASAKLGIGVTFDEAKEITRLSELIATTKEAAGNFDDLEKRMNYGHRLIDMYDYLETLRPGKKLGEKLVSLANVPRALMATLDLSAPFRQGFGMVTRKEFWKNLIPMLKFAGSEKSFKNLQADIISRPNYNLMKKANLRITILGDKLLDREEAFMTDLFDEVAKIGRVSKAITAPLRGSERAYTGFLTKLRVDMFDNFIEKARLAGEDIRPGSKATKDLADMVNNFTGAGTLGRFETAKPILNTLFFSPSKLAATVNMFNPMKYLDPNISRTAKKEAFRNLVGMLAVSAGLMSVAKAIGGENVKVEMNPTSSDFGKIRIGNTRYDVSGGNASYLVMLARLTSGKMKVASTNIVKDLDAGGFGASTRGDIFMRFLRYKLSPNTSFIADAFTGVSAIGKKFDVATLKRFGTENAILTRLMPIIVSNAIETAYDDPNAVLPMTLADLVGIGTNNYGFEQNWNDRTTKEMIKLKESIGQDKFDKANDEYNKKINKNLTALMKTDEYEDMDSESKQKRVTREKRITKKKAMAKWRRGGKEIITGDAEREDQSRRFEQLQRFRNLRAS